MKKFVILRFFHLYLDRIGWRKSSRKIILLATDGDYHNALDGKLGTIHKRRRHFFFQFCDTALLVHQLWIINYYVK